ncbi:GH1 family beta-glucosidase [Paenibacillus shunpengii]|uniref:Beta-glucosidase n=1 Tax=Paenibacillus shunpengii TaxID=2054424 RepID=A0ABW5STZ9_9BACL|nr:MULTISPECIES: GH1 family beta-glucosidase [unclassified Paenibacillus]OMC64037.1 beta-glucosidase [Paenibacillus sp. FSL H7-0326]SDX67195.1 broad-specificity cellobiase [Paenibacillus sp. PDC88]
MTIFQFPKDFQWGTATAAYQIEGAAAEDGRGPSIWDTFAKTPGKVFNGDNGDIACDSYHRYEEDIALMKQLGIQSYRFSVSWSRILPDGDGEINQAGLDYYHRFVDKLLENGIEPFCTLYHWDLPQTLQDAGGWESDITVEAFVKFSEIMYREFNGKIKSWLTFNEPWCIAFLSNLLGAHAPGNRDLQTALNVGHGLLLAHGKSVKKFRELGIEGKIGIAPNMEWAVPYSKSEADKAASERHIAWFADWFLDPVFKGEYPQFMVDWFEQAGAKVDVKPGDMEIISQPIDHLGINYYTMSVDRYNPDAGVLGFEQIDMGLVQTDIGWPVESRGLYEALHHLQKYGNIDIYITENGACINDEVENGQVKDFRRISYLQQHIAQIHRAITDGIQVKGYMAWSMMDNFEWAEGYRMRFGLVHVDYRSLVRTPKESFYWYQNVIRNNWLETRPL